MINKSFEFKIGVIGLGYVGTPLRSTYQLHGLPEIQAAIYVITKPLDIDQCGMPLITVIYIFRYT